MNYLNNTYIKFGTLALIAFLLVTVTITNSHNNVVYVNGKKVTLGASTNNNPEYLGLGSYAVQGIDILENEGFSVDQIGQVQASLSDMLNAKFENKLTKVVFLDKDYSDLGLKFQLQDEKSQTLAEGYIIDDRGRGFTITLTSLNGAATNISSGYVSLEDLNG